jgi:hypothetical protein
MIPCSCSRSIQKKKERRPADSIEGIDRSFLARALDHGRVCAPAWAGPTSRIDAPDRSVRLERALCRYTTDLVCSLARDLAIEALDVFSYGSLQRKSLHLVIFSGGACSLLPTKLTMLLTTLSVAADGSEQPPNLRLLLLLSVSLVLLCRVCLLPPNIRLFSLS